jgi:argininosuccinate lyase
VKLWGGRFRETPDASLKRFNDSFSFDVRLLAEDIEGSIAWAGALRRAGVLSADEAESIIDALREIGREAPSGDYEDVHSYVESKLTDRIGALAGKLHTGRSRNDQVATDLKLFLRGAATEAKEQVLLLAETLAGRAKDEAATVMPGYTHLQQAEVITFGHWNLAYVEMLLRDAGRFDHVLATLAECPLGSGALAGSPLEIDRHALATSLGFERPTANSLDAVSDRDAAAEYLFGTTMLLSHLSRLAEDLILFCTSEFAFVQLPDAWATGSSRMPQKKNPDVLELVRGHAARSIGELTGFLALLKGLPLAYNKDLQLDKEPLFRTADVIATALPALNGLVRGLELQRERMAAAAENDQLLATQLADAMTRRGVPFRRSHEIVGRRLAEAQAAGTTIRALGPSDDITERDLEAIDLELAVSKKRAFGGTAPARVRAAAVEAMERIATARAQQEEYAR